MRHDPLTEQELLAACDPATPLGVAGLGTLCRACGVTIHDELWWTILGEEGHLDRSDHPLHATMLARLARELRTAGFQGVAERIERHLARPGGLPAAGGGA